MTRASSVIQSSISNQGGVTNAPEVISGPAQASSGLGIVILVLVALGAFVFLKYYDRKKESDEVK